MSEPSRRARPDMSVELALGAAGSGRLVAGIDEAGRGALAGPVVAGAVILPLDKPDALTALAGVDDSKRLSAAQRERLFTLIAEHALAWAVGQVPAPAIDAGGILPATREAMRLAVLSLPATPSFLLIDGRIRLPALPIPQQSLVRGDARCLSIAAASIMAKVTRDRLMVALDADYPGFGLARHKGYCTRQHEAALARIGPSIIHRHSFAPIRHTLL